MTKEEWKDVEGDLRGAYGAVKLTIDGFDISLQRQIDNNHIVTTIYVDGSIKVINLGGEETEINRRFYRPSTRYLRKMKPGENREKEIRKLKRLGLGKYADIYQKRVTMFWPWWNNFNSMKKHLIKNNESIEFAKKNEIAL